MLKCSNRNSSLAPFFYSPGGAPAEFILAKSSRHACKIQPVPRQSQGDRPRLSVCSIYIASQGAFR
jgi:hypothetical protein